MADIQITCPGCATVNTASEFVDAENFICRDCGIKLKKPAHAGKTKQTATVKRSPMKTTVSAAQVNNDSQGSERQPNPAANKQVDTTAKPHPHATIRTTTKLKREARKFELSDHIKSWLVFAVLGGITGLLRYGGVLTPNDIEMFDSAAPIIFVFAHIATCLMIAKEEVHCGIISFLIPPYMLYYLFSVSDRFYYRAVIAGLAVGMGQATTIFWVEMITNLVGGANDWIQNPYSS